MSDRKTRHAEWCATHREQRREEIRAYQAAYYQENKTALLQKHTREQDKLSEWLQILRSVNGCGDCETHRGKLGHHHVDPDTKLHNISRMYGCSLDALEEELERCVVLCYSCHKKRHDELRSEGVLA